MEKEFVVDSRIIGTGRAAVTGGGVYAQCTVACDAPAFLPGQYLMVRLAGPGVNWPYPYVITGVAPGGYTVLANAGQPLARCHAGDKVQYWGPRGSGAVAPSEKLTLVAQPQTAYLLAPFDGPLAEWALLPAVQSGEAARQTGQAMAAAQGRKPLVALNPDALMALDAALPDEARARSLLFVSNKKACGFDACKGCYLHSETDSFGINVCCQGPFMPWPLVDLARDIGCFEYFPGQEVRQ